MCVSLCRCPIPTMEVLCFSFIAYHLAPRPATLPRDAVVKEFTKIPLFDLVHPLLNSPPEPQWAWAAPLMCHIAQAQPE